MISNTGKIHAAYSDPLSPWPAAHGPREMRVRRALEEIRLGLRRRKTLPVWTMQHPRYVNHRLRYLDALLTGCRGPLASRQSAGSEVSRISNRRLGWVQHLTSLTPILAEMEMRRAGQGTAGPGSPWRTVGQREPGWQDDGMAEVMEAPRTFSFEDVCLLLGVSIFAALRFGRFPRI